MWHTIGKHVLMAAGVIVSIVIILFVVVVNKMGDGKWEQGG